MPVSPTDNLELLNDATNGMQFTQDANQEELAAFDQELFMINKYQSTKTDFDFGSDINGREFTMSDKVVNTSAISGYRTQVEVSDAKIIV